MGQGLASRGFGRQWVDYAEEGGEACMQAHESRQRDALVLHPTRAVLDRAASGTFMRVV
jgi:hypothetical protein